MIKLSDYVIHFLEETGAKHMFMIPGGGAMHLNDSLGRSNKIQYVCCLHEQACAIAAEAYARVTNNIGLLMVTTGPGGTNALTGVAGAYLESTPVFVVSGQVKRLDMIRNQGIRQQGMQELDIISVVKPITKYAVLVDEPHMIRYHLERALYEAMHGRKGPVWLDIPLDVQATMIDENMLIGYEPYETPNNTQLEKQVLKVIDLINNSERPVLLAGNGIRLANGLDSFNKLIQALGVPVLTTWNGIDLIDNENSLFFGRPGGLGQRYANFMQQNSDLFISIGARLNLLQTGYNFDGFARNATKVMVDIDNAELYKINVRPDLPICADAKDFMNMLLAHKDKLEAKDRKKWFNYGDRLKEKYPVSIGNDMRRGFVNTYHLIDEIAKQMSSDSIYVAGSSGSCIEISMQAFKVKKGQRVFTTKGLASMGYGLPSTIGAVLASGGKKTVCVNGDGGFQMNIQELQTIYRLNQPIKIFVLCNQGYAAIFGTQSNLFEGNLVGCNEESNLSLPDVICIAKAYNLRTVEIENDMEVADKVQEVLLGEDPVICKVNVPIDLKVLPKQVSYKNNEGQMESLPLEYLNPMLNEDEFRNNMLIPLFQRDE